MERALKGLDDGPPVVLANLVPLEAILCTEELWRRPRRAPDHAAENRALGLLVQGLADSPSTILETLAQTILDAFSAGSAGISLLTTDERRFSWAAIAGAWSPHLGGGTPRDFGPCGDVLDRNAPLLFTHWEKRYPYLLEATPLAEEGLLVPFHVAGKAVGTIWAIAHDRRRNFDAEDLRQLESLGRFAAAAYQAARLQQAEALVNELNHRVKNTLATVQSIAAHTFRTAADPEQSRGVFDARLIALSRTHDLLARCSWEGAALGDLLRQELDPFSAAASAAFELAGPDLELRPKAALALGLAFHELVTNAAKYGALSVPGGRVKVAWEIGPSDDGPILRLTWRETGGPRIEAAARKGFGTTVIERGLALELDAKVALDFRRDGLLCSMDIPLPAGT